VPFCVLKVLRAGEIQMSASRPNPHGKIRPDTDFSGWAQFISIPQYGGCLLRLQTSAMDDIAGGALDEGVLAEDLREESVKLRAVHVLRHAAGEASSIGLRQKNTSA
jgi:hypothetical protein